MGASFSYPLRVRYSECDPQGVVFNAHYLAYFDLAITELWRAAFGSYETMLAKGLDIVVGEAQLSFRGAARFDDQLTLEVAIAAMGTTSIQSVHRISRDRELLIEGKVRHVMVQREALSKTPIPDWIREGLEPWTVDSTAELPAM